MALGYTADQFYGVTPTTIGPGGLVADPTGETSNPPFAFPGSTRKELNPLTGKMEDKTGIKRGFIRMLTDMPGTQGAQFADLAKKRCFFQFNPQTIMRAVSMSEGMYNPLLQDPSQFALPMPGNANFTFELLFDRSFEVNSQLAAIPTVQNQGPNAGLPVAPPTDETFLNRLMGGSPADIGVLADIRVLDSIVGQGISEDLIDYILARGEIVQSYLSDTTTTTDTGASTGSTTTTSSVDTSNGTFTWDTNKATTALNANLGNQAFLIPNPVRVLFSSLFMVDGYIQGMSVTFNKFSRTMVPTQCLVTIQMQALYLGFARERTYLTDSLKESVVKPIDSSSADVGTPSITVPAGDENGKKAQDLLLKYFTKFYVHVAGTDPNASGFDYVDEPIPENKFGEGDGSRSLYQILRFNSPKVGLAIGLPKIPVSDGEDSVMWTADSPGSIGNNLIKSVTITGRIKVTRDPFGSVEKQEYNTSVSSFMNKRGNLLDVSFSWDASSADKWKSNQDLDGDENTSWTKYVNGDSGVTNNYHYSLTARTKGEAENLYMLATTDPGRKKHPCTMKVTATISVEYVGGKSPLVATVNSSKFIYGGWNNTDSSHSSMIRGTFDVNFSSSSHRGVDK